MENNSLPRISTENDKPCILIVDDLFGRSLQNETNQDRVNLCSHYDLEDVTDDQNWYADETDEEKTIAKAFFIRGQKPVRAAKGDIVKNDPEGTLDFIKNGWQVEETGERRPWALILLDLSFDTGMVTGESEKRKGKGMPEGCSGDIDPNRYFGIELLAGINKRFPELPVVILSSMSQEEIKEKYSEYGAFSFLKKFSDNGSKDLEHLLESNGLFPDKSGLIVGSSLKLLLALRVARKARQHNRNILIRGDRGTGKELLAEYLWKAKEDESRPWGTINCAELSPELYGSELFGYVKGAFTGAYKDTPGLIEKVKGGDLFLDEIGTLSYRGQQGLLRATYNKEIRRVGGERYIPVNVRFISATNEDIEGNAAIEVFRPDLLDRLRTGGTIVIPPLRERKEDIPALAEIFVRKAERETPSAIRREISGKTLDMLAAHSWPGNIRELENCISRAVNDYPKIEILQPVHIKTDIPAESRITISGADHPDLNRPENLDMPTDRPDAGTVNFDLDSLLRYSQEYSFDGSDDQKGKYLEIRRACAEFIAQYLKAALEATKDRAKDDEIQLQPALKWMTGDKNCTTTDAQREFKRILKPLASSITDPVLKEAWERSNK